MNSQTFKPFQKYFVLSTLFWLLHPKWQTCAVSEDLSIWAPLKSVNCARLLHIRLSSYHFYDDFGLNKANVDTPIMISTRNWTKEQAELIPDMHTECILRILISDYNTSNLLEKTADVFARFQWKVHEYFLVVTTCLSCVGNSSNWLYDSLGHIWSVNKIDDFYLKRPSLVVIELRQDMEQIALIHNIWSSCPKRHLYRCAYTLNVSGTLTAATSTVSIHSWILHSFSPLNWHLSFDNERWPFLLQIMYDEELTEEGNAAVAKSRLRDLLTRPGDMSLRNSYNVAILKVALEIAHKLNGSVHSRYDETMPRPMSVITFSDRNRMPSWHETYFAKTLAYNFLQCSKNGLVIQISDPFLIFQPFDAWTWGFLAISSVAFCLVSRHLKRYIPSFVILRAMLQPSFDSKRWIPATLLIMWTFACLLLVNFYSSEIQSLYVVPTKLQPFRNFKAVEQGGYRILCPYFWSTHLGFNSPKLYWYGLENTAELFHGYHENRIEFWRHFFGSSKRVFPDDDGLIENIVQVVNGLAESERCYVGREQIVSRYYFWFVSGPNVGRIRSHLGSLQAAGVMQWHIRLFRQGILAERMFEIERAIREPALAFMVKDTIGSDIITIQDLKMIFIYGGVGFLMSFVVYLLVRLLEFV